MKGFVILVIYVAFEACKSSTFSQNVNPALILPAPTSETINNRKQISEIVSKLETCDQVLKVIIAGSFLHGTGNPGQADLDMKFVLSKEVPSIDFFHWDLYSLYFNAPSLHRVIPEEFVHDMYQTVSRCLCVHGFEYSIGKHTLQVDLSNQQKDRSSILIVKGDRPNRIEVQDFLTRCGARSQIMERDEIVFDFKMNTILIALENVVDTSTQLKLHSNFATGEKMLGYIIYQNEDANIIDSGSLPGYEHVVTQLQNEVVAESAMVVDSSIVELDIIPLVRVPDENIKTLNQYLKEEVESSMGMFYAGTLRDSLVSEQASLRTVRFNVEDIAFRKIKSPKVNLVVRQLKILMKVFSNKHDSLLVRHRPDFQRPYVGFHFEVVITYYYERLAHCFEDQEADETFVCVIMELSEIAASDSEESCTFLIRACREEGKLQLGGAGNSAGIPIRREKFWLYLRESMLKMEDLEDEQKKNEWRVLYGFNYSKDYPSLSLIKKTFDQYQSNFLISGKRKKRLKLDLCKLRI